MRRRFTFGTPTLLLSLVFQVLGLFLPGILAILSEAVAAAPITPSGLNTQVNLAPTPPPGKVQYDITGGTRPGGGTNLYHSFGDFNVPNNNIANFLNSGSVDLAGNPLAAGLPTSNILGRVTGGNISNIFGMIQTNGPGGFPNANLFLINPAGFLFGPNATVNVGGMVAFSSANYLRLADGKLFNAVPNEAADALLSTAPVAAYGFLGSNPGAITVQGSQLSVTPGQSISLVGGNITIQSGTLDNGKVQPARLSAPNGQINLASTASPGEFLLSGLQAGGIQAFAINSPFTSLVGPNVNGATFTSFGLVHVAKGSTIDTSQTGNSNVSIRSGQLVLNVQDALLNTSTATPPASGQDNILISPGSSIVGATLSADRGPDVLIVADSINMAGTPPGPGPPNFAFIKTATTGTGDAGNISLMATHNIDAAASTISSSSSPIASGASGNISLTSTAGNISLTKFTQVTSQSTGTGSTGMLTLDAPHGDVLLDSIALFNNIQSSSFTEGTNGGIQITANNLTLRHSSAPPAGISIDNFSTQVPGNITINLSGNLSLDGQSFIQTVARGPALAAADINVTAHNVSITNGSFVNTQTISSGVGGKLNIFADNIQLTNGGQLRSGSISGPDVFTGKPTIPSGPGGTLNVQGHAGPAVSVLIDGAKSGIFTNAQGTGAAGNTNIAAQSVTIQNGGTISAATSGTAPSATGGTITVNANQVQVNSGGLITAATTGAGAGGSVNINSGSTFSSDAGAVSSAATQATGGDINLTAGQSVTLTNGASISASSTGAGNAGSIQINAGNQLAMTNSSVTTEATQSGGGLIKITTTPSGGVQLTNSKISASVLDGNGGGGSVNIDPQFVVLQNSQILAQAVQGPGGNISITTNLLLPDSTSIISASSQFGQQGSVTIQSPIAPAGGKVFPLQQKPLLATTLLGQRCAALAGGNISSFTMAGRDSLPAEPSGWLSSPLALGTAESDGTVKEASSRTSESEAAEAPPLLSLRHIAPPGFLTQSFAVDSSGCES